MCLCGDSRAIISHDIRKWTYLSLAALLSSVCSSSTPVMVLVDLPFPFEAVSGLDLSTTLSWAFVRDERFLAACLILSFRLTTWSVAYD
jgi:hypothetical protein